MKTKVLPVGVVIAIFACSAPEKEVEQGSGGSGAAASGGSAGTGAASSGGGTAGTGGATGGTSAVGGTAGTSAGGGTGATGGAPSGGGGAPTGGGGAPSGGGGASGGGAPSGGGAGGTGGCCGVACEQSGCVAWCSSNGYPAALYCASASDCANGSLNCGAKLLAAYPTYNTIDGFNESKCPNGNCCACAKP